MIKQEYKFISCKRLLIYSRRALVLSITFLSTLTAVAQTPQSFFRIGEKLTYNISFGSVPDGGFAEFYVVSSGKLNGNNAVEMRSRIKTVGLVSAAFALIDERRTVFAAPDTGLPVYVRKVTSDGPLPLETIHNYLAAPTSNFDLITLIYKARGDGGTGTYTFLEGDRIYTAAFSTKSKEKVKTDAGDFVTTVSTVQSEFLSANGIKELRINFTSDADHVPVLIRFKTPRGEFRASLASVHIDEPVSTASPTPTPVPTPVIAATPRPTPSPQPYVDNRPLLPELGFQLGETLAYSITSNGKAVGIVSLEARERKKFERKDSLLLTATITGTEPGNKTFSLGDSIKAQVDPDTLTPRWFEGTFGHEVSSLNQTVIFDPKTGNITFGTAAPVDSPIGTHSLLSLIYAMRSFNLEVSKDPGNPVNDTRVAVFWGTRAYVFTLRPSNPADIVINGEKTSAQMITINTGNPQLDALAIKIWLNTNTRVPLRFSVGTYQADLVSTTVNPPK